MSFARPAAGGESAGGRFLFFYNIIWQPFAVFCRLEGFGLLLDRVQIPLHKGEGHSHG